MSCSLNSIFMCFYDVFSNLSSGYFFSKLQGTKVVLDLYVVPSTSTLLYHISDLDCILPVLQRHVCVCTPGVQLHYFCWPTCQTTVIYHTQVLRLPVHVYHNPVVKGAAISYQQTTTKSIFNMVMVP